LTPAESYAIDLEPEDRTREEAVLAADAKRKLEIDFVSAAKRAPEELQLKSLEIASQIRDVENMIAKSNIYRNQMNYDYWQLRCEAEQDDLMLEARRLLFDAKQLYEESDLDGEIAKYEQAFEKWREVYDKYRKLVDDVSSDDVLEAIDRYRIATDQSILPPEFPLKIFYEMHLAEGQVDAEEYTRLLRESGDSDGPRLPRVNVARPYTGLNTEKAPPVLELPTEPALLPGNVKEARDELEAEGTEESATSLPEDD